MKHYENKIKTLIFFLFAIIIQKSVAQEISLKSDTAYPTSFIFLSAGDPLGLYLYNVDNIQSGIAVFEYTDGRKFVGHVVNSEHDENTVNRIYYPNGIIYIGKTPLSNKFAPAAIY